MGNLNFKMNAQISLDFCLRGTHKFVPGYIYFKRHLFGKNYLKICLIKMNRLVVIYLRINFMFHLGI